MNRFVLIADTENYAGNFEREMCAWVTGRIGDCGVGNELASKVSAEEDPDPTDPRITMSTELWEWCQDWIEMVPDEHANYRPVAIGPTPGYFNDGHGNHYKEGADPETVRLAYNKALEQQAERSRNAYVNKEYGEKEAQRILERLDQPGHHSAYQSVEMYFMKEPPTHLVEEMTERVKVFCQEHKAGGIAEGRMGRFCSRPTLTRVRLVKREVKTIDTSLWESE